MAAIDIVFGFLAGVVSCPTPQALLLLPLAVAAAGVDRLARTIALAAGLGLSLVLTGFLAGSSGAIGFDAFWFRRLVCALLILQAIVLITGTAWFPRLTGQNEPRALRLLLLALLVGANWLPLVGPVLGKASLMAADFWNSGWALPVLFAFGMGAAVPWICLGRVIRFVLRAFAGDVVHGMASRRILGVALLTVAIAGGSGLDSAITHWLDAAAPAWTRKLATTF